MLNAASSVAPVVAIISAARRRVVKKLRARGATARETAQPLEDLGRVERRLLDRLVKTQVVREVTPGRYYLDESAWEESQATRRNRALMVLVIVLVMIAVLFFLNPG